MAVIDNPILNSPFREPTSHFKFDEEGITNEIASGRRPSSHFVPIPRMKKKGKPLQFETEWTKDRIEANPVVDRGEMFDAWFDVELTDSVFDLMPHEPPTPIDPETAELLDVAGRCAWCEVELDKGVGSLITFGLADRGPFSVFEGRVLPLLIDGRVVPCIVAPQGPEDTSAGDDDVVVRVCGPACEAAVGEALPEALRLFSLELTNGEPPESIH